MGSHAMPEPLSELLRRRLGELKDQAGISDHAIAISMNELAPGVTSYQQKVSDFFSGEMKRPSMDFTAAVCGALGISLSEVLTSIERGAPLRRDQDWEWLMFGRQLGPAGRAAARGFVDGLKPSSTARPAAAKRRRATRRKTAAGKP